MNVIEETLDATLDSGGHLQLTHQPTLPPGPVRVTIRVATVGPKRGLVDVIREIRADQIARGYLGLTTEQLRQREAELEAENDDYDREMGTTRGVAPACLGKLVMLVYLDTNIVIYAVQAGVAEHQRAIGHLANLELAGHRFAISELTRTESPVLPFQPGNGQLLQDFSGSFRAQTCAH